MMEMGGKRNGHTGNMPNSRSLSHDSDLLRVEATRVLHQLEQLNKRLLERGSMTIQEAHAARALLGRSDELLKTVNSEVKTVMGRNYLGAEVWAKLGVNTSEPLCPSQLSRAFLESQCPFKSHSKIRDTHLLVLLPEGMSIKKLKELLGIKGIAGIINDFPMELETQEFYVNLTVKTEWVLIPKFPLPGSFNMTYGEQDTVLLKYPGYRTSSAIELSTGAILNFVANEERIYSEDIGWCSDKCIGGIRVRGGFFTPKGFDLICLWGDKSFRLGRAVSMEL